MSRAVNVAFAVLALVIAPGVAQAQAPAPPVQPFAPQAPAPPALAPPAPAPPTIAPPAPAAPAIAINPADGSGECVTTTTTTTRCTGAAAPFAAHPAPPAVIVAPPPPVYAPAVIPIALPPGWHLQQDPAGGWWRVRRHHGQPSLWVPGMVLWLSSYLGGMSVGIIDGAPETMFPIVGSFVAAGLNDSSEAKIGWAVDGIAQLAGFVMFIAGASLDGKLERIPVTVGPTSFYGGGNGVALSGRF